MDISKYISNDSYNKRTSLQNIGATCYINTLIQCLLSCTYFNNFVLSQDYNNRIQNDNNDKKNIFLITELRNIFKSMWIDGNSLNPIRFLKTLKLKFNFIEINSQNDIHEILLLILNKLNEEIKINDISKYTNNKINHVDNNSLQNLKKNCYEKWFEMHKKEYSELNEILYHHKITQIICGNCNHIHHNHDSSCIIDIEIPIVQDNNKYQLIDCIKNHMNTELLNSNPDMKWTCDECNNSEISEKSTKYWKLPPTLIISLKRFIYDKDSNNMIKNNIYIDAPLELNLSEYVLSNNNSKYKLKSVANHFGNLNNGHYFSIVKNKDKWTIIDDLSIKTVDEKDILFNLGYILFYEICV
tara:strand:+ start:446 stop:1513 length:1068 start_codon:yes stop_codon:yes gene_type:complete